MKLAVIILGALVGTALAEGQNNFNMPNINMLNGKMPQIPPGMKIDDLKDAFHNMPPSMKERLHEMAGKFGMQLDDVEDALNNPPQKLKDYFENNGQKAEVPIVQQGGFQGVRLPTQNERPTPNGARPGGMPSMGGIDIGSLLKNVDMGSIGNMMKGMDIGSMMKGMDMGMVGDLMKNMDIGSMMQGMDMGMVGDVMKNMDMGSIGNIMKNMDMGAMGNIMKNVDIGSMMQGMDMGMVGDIMKNMDMGAVGDIMKNVDIGSITGMVKDMDIGAIGKMVGGKIPKNMKEAKKLIGVPEDASLNDIQKLLKEKLEKMGVPLDDPKAMLQYATEKLRTLNIPLPEGVEIADLMNMLHGHLESMGIPTEPELLKNYVMKHFGLDDLNLAELEDPSAIADILKRKAFRMLGLNEHEDPMTIKDRIEQQLYEEVQKHGAQINKESSTDHVKQEMEKVMTKELKNMGLEVESLAPHHLQRAVKSKMSGMGFPMGDLKALKSHVMNMVMKQLMNKAMPMIMKMFMPHRQQPRPQGPPMMPHMMPPMMPHMMMPMMPPMMMPMPPMTPLNLDIEVNVEQPEQTRMPNMPRYLQGAEHALDHPIEYMDDRQVFNHIMAVREGLRSGEMSEEAVQEMLDDLMQARLKMRVLSVKNMFLRDRVTAMERQTRRARPMPAMRAPRRQSRREPAPFMPRSSRRQSPAIMRALRSQRVF